MKVSQLAAVSGEAISTIKFYIRIGLLHPGRSSAKNQAHYDETHVQRLALISILQRELALNMEQLDEAFAATDRVSWSASPVRRAKGGSSSERVLPAELGLAQREVEATARDLGWLVEAGDPVIVQIARSVAIISHVLPHAIARDYLPRFAQAMNELSLQEIEHERRIHSGDVSDDSSYVLHTIAFEPLLVGLRRMARSQRLAQIQIMEEADDRNPKSPKKDTLGERGRSPPGPSAKQGAPRRSAKRRR